MSRMYRVLIILILLLKEHCGFSQLLTNSNILISIGGGVQLTVKGDIENNLGAVIDNNGTLDLTGDWINNSGSNIFGASSGTVVLNGLNQTIGGTDETLFNNLNIFNGTKAMMVDTETGGLFSGGRLNINNAILDLNSNELRIRNPGALAITRTSGYILSEDSDNSSKVWWVSVGQQGIHIIPFGNVLGEIVFFSFTMIPSTAPGGTSSSSLRVSTYQSMPDNSPFPITPSLVMHVNDLLGNDNSANTVDRFWHIEQKCTSSQYYFNYAPSENAANGNINMRAQRWNTINLGWDAALPGQSNPNAQQVLLPNVLNQNTLIMEGATWAISLLSNPLPIELINFAAEEKNNSQVICRWATVSEINNDYFIVERSKDGINFDKVGIVDGAGNSTAILHYSIIDANPYSGVSYYRLKQVDFNGGYSYSQTVQVKLRTEDYSVSIYPNPASSYLYIEYISDFSTRISYSILDITGKLILTGSFAPDAAMQQIPMQKLCNGFYFITIDDGLVQTTKKFQVVK